MSRTASMNPIDVVIAHALTGTKDSGNPIRLYDNLAGNPEVTGPRGLYPMTLVRLWELLDEEGIGAVRVVPERFSGRVVGMAVGWLAATLHRREVKDLADPRGVNHYIREIAGAAWQAQLEQGLRDPERSLWEVWREHERVVGSACLLREQSLTVREQVRWDITQRRLELSGIAAGTGEGYKAVAEMMRHGEESHKYPFLGYWLARECLWGLAPGEPRWKQEIEGSILASDYQWYHRMGKRLNRGELAAVDEIAERGEAAARLVAQSGGLVPAGRETGRETGPGDAEGKATEGS